MAAFHISGGAPQSSDRSLLCPRLCPSPHFQDQKIQPYPRPLTSLSFIPFATRGDFDRNRRSLRVMSFGTFDLFGPYPSRGPFPSPIAAHLRLSSSFVHRSDQKKEYHSLRSIGGCDGTHYVCAGFNVWERLWSKHPSRSWILHTPSLSSIPNLSGRLCILPFSACSRARVLPLFLWGFGC